MEMFHRQVPNEFLRVSLHNFHTFAPVGRRIITVIATAASLILRLVDHRSFDRSVTFLALPVLVLEFDFDSILSPMFGYER